MFNLKKLHNDESGITALETAIILIAFIVVASVFAFTILSAGTSSTQRGSEAINAGLKSVQSSMEIKGSVVALDESAAGTVGKVVFTLGLVSGGDPIDLTSDANKVVVIGYRDATQFVNDLPWSVAWIGANNGDALLEQGELAELTLDLSGLTTALGPNTQFTIEVKPPVGAVLDIQRTTPAAIGAVTDLK
jgi:flagellin FlaB